jgi:hypothetical protein
VCVCVRVCARARVCVTDGATQTGRERCSTRQQRTGGQRLRAQAPHTPWHSAAQRSTRRAQRRAPAPAAHLVVVAQQAVEEVERLWRHQVRVLGRHKLAPGLAAVVADERLELCARACVRACVCVMGVCVWVCVMGVCVWVCVMGVCVWVCVMGVCVCVMGVCGCVSWVCVGVCHGCVCHVCVMCVCVMSVCGCVSWVCVMGVCVCAGVMGVWSVGAHKERERERERERGGLALTGRPVQTKQGLGTPKQAPAAAHAGRRPPRRRAARAPRCTAHNTMPHVRRRPARGRSTPRAPHLRVQLQAVLGQVLKQRVAAQHARNLDELVVVVVAAEKGVLRARRRAAGACAACARACYNTNVRAGQRGQLGARVPRQPPASQRPGEPPRRAGGRRPAAARGRRAHTRTHLFEHERRKHGAQAPQVERVIIVLQVHEQLGALVVPVCGGGARRVALLERRERRVL